LLYVAMLHYNCTHHYEQALYCSIYHKHMQLQKFVIFNEPFQQAYAAVHVFMHIDIYVQLWVWAMPASFWLETTENK